MKNPTSLIGLHVYGCGTDKQESLASYFHRLRITNYGQSRDWLSRINQPNAIHDIKLLRHGYKKSALTIQWMRAKGCPDEVDNLGWAKQPIISPASSRVRRAWCGQCLAEHPGHELALWSFSDYQVCHIHGNLLAECCGQCGWIPRFHTSQTHNPGHCDNCKNQITQLEQSQEPTHWQIFCSNELAKWQVNYQRGDSNSGLFNNFRNQAALRNSVQAGLYWSWLTGLDFLDGTPCREPKEQVPYADVSLANHNFLITQRPELSLHLSGFIKDRRFRPRKLNAITRRKRRSSGKM